MSSPGGLYAVVVAQCLDYQIFQDVMRRCIHLYVARVVAVYGYERVDSAGEPGLVASSYKSYISSTRKTGWQNELVFQ